jgi:VIT1/CCC1 family predicted Fe2+/Mn2+ transporter
MLTNAIIIIFIFNFYISVAKEVSFIKKFSEMAALSLGIAALSFLLGYVIKNSLAVEV